MKHLLALLLLVAPAYAAPPTTFPQLLKAATPPGYLVRIYQIDSDGDRSAGTGALISKDLILTASHVVDGKVGSKVEVLFLSDWSVVLGEVIKVDPNDGAGPEGKGHDVALIKVPPRKEKPIPIAVIASKGPATIQGYAYGPYLKQTGDYYSLDTTSRWGIIKNAQARNGDSGGPVTQGGALIGVLWGASDNHTWFTPIQKIVVLIPEIRSTPLQELDKVKNESPSVIYSLR